MSANVLVPFQPRLWLASHQIKWDPPRHTRDGQSAPSPGPGSLPRAASPPGRPARSPFWATLRRPRAPSQLRKHPWARKHVGGKRLQAASSPWPGSPPLQNGQVSGQPSWGRGPALGQRDAVRPSRHLHVGFQGRGDGVQGRQRGRLSQDTWTPPARAVCGSPVQATTQSQPFQRAARGFARPDRKRREAARDPDASARQPRGEAAARGTHIRGFLRAVPCHPPSAAREGRPPKPPSFLRSLWCPQRQPPLSPGRLGLGRVRPWAGQSVRLRGRGLLASSTPGLVRARATTRAPRPVRARATTCALRPVRRGQTARGHAATILSFYLKTHDQGPRTSPHSKELQPRPPRRPNTHVYRQRHPAGGENQAGAPGPARRPCGPEHGPHPSESRRSPAAERCRRPGPYLDQEVPRPQSGLPGHPAFIHRLQVLQRWERGRWRELLDGRVRWKARTPR